MYFKKILFIFFFILFLLIIFNDNSFAVTLEYNDESYYFEDIPVDLEKDKYVLLLDKSNNKFYLIKIDDGCNLGFSISDNKIYCYNDTTIVNFDYYSCSYNTNIDENYGTDYLCSTFGLSTSSNNLSLGSVDLKDILTYIYYVYGTVNLYPCYQNQFIVTNLSEGCNWTDDFLLGYHSGAKKIAIYYPTQSSGYFYINKYNQVSYYNGLYGIEGSSVVAYSCYVLNNGNWEFYATYSNNCSYSGLSSFLYFNKDLLSYDDNSVVYNNTSKLFSNLYDESNVIIDGETISSGSNDGVIGAINSGFRNFTNFLENILNNLSDEQISYYQEQIALANQHLQNSVSIFDKIGQIVDFINPFSDNFFVYKLIQLLSELLQGLFVPDSDFIVGYVNELNDFFSDRLGILYYPFDLVVSTVDRIILEMTLPHERPGADPSQIYIYYYDYNIHIPEFKLFGTTLIPASEIDFNSLLENPTFENIHNIYLIVVDVILILLLVYYVHNVFVDIFGGKYIDNFVDNSVDGVREYNINRKKGGSDYKRSHIGFDTGGNK